MFSSIAYNNLRQQNNQLYIQFCQRFIRRHRHRTKYRIVQKFGEEKGKNEPAFHLFPRICRVLYEVMMNLSVEHPLFLLGAYLNPLLREMEFIPGIKKRSEHCLKAEEFARKMLQKYILKNRCLLKMQSESMTRTH